MPVLRLVVGLFTAGVGVIFLFSPEIVVDVLGASFIILGGYQLLGWWDEVR